MTEYAKTIGYARFELVLGDITEQQVDAIVNAANNGLRGGGGVDGAIHRAGGPAIMAECRKIGHCDTGDAVITTAGDLPAKYVIHTVGPVWHGGNKGQPELLANCYRSSLQLARENNISSIAFPAISTGVYGYPPEQAASVAIDTITQELQKAGSLRLVRLVLFNESLFLSHINLFKTSSSGNFPLD